MRCVSTGATSSSRRPNGFIGRSIRPKSERLPACDSRLAGAPDTSWASRAIALREGGALAQGGLAQICRPRRAACRAQGSATVGLPPRPCSISGIFRPPGMPSRFSTMVV